MVEIIKKNLSGFTGKAWLVKKNKKIKFGETGETEYFVVSGTNAMFSGWEVLVFPATEEGDVLDWGEVCGGRGITHEDAMKELEAL